MTDLTLYEPPNIATFANPKATDLLTARAEITRNPEVFSKIFKDFGTSDNYSEDLSILELTKALEVRLQGLVEGDAHEVACYLSNEYAQLGSNPYLVSTKTGKVLYVVKDEDLYTPAPMAREGSTALVPQTPKIRPDIEAALVMYEHNVEREEHLLQVLSEKGHSTELLKVLGDPRLLVATRGGRKQIVSDIMNTSAQTLIESAGGTSKLFLKCFEIITEEPETQGLGYIKGVVSAKSVLGIQDPTSFNLNHNRSATLRGALVQGWLRAIALMVTEKAEWEPTTLHIGSDLSWSGIWIVPPYLMRALREKYPQMILFPVEGAKPTRILGQAGYLKIPPTIEAMNREWFDRWETLTYIEFEAWYNPLAMQTFVIEGVEEVVQVLS